MIERKKEIYISIEQNDELLCLSVEDNGCGIDQRHLPYIFDEGFSTKDKKNRGIGLYLLQQIVKKGNGKIHVESEMGKGTIFTITFDM